ncbi:GGDEF domain-containing protein [Siculibacillus lacustris]|uniref:diguanylate cyclase n=1 Tax=Siculibacillus lacustris TaxID=1549641 RepID=A0A4Q9VHX0_9HYPH|nr:diguanylate cyclase [Siculibacillus lacustris]TBW34767.1 GGDEF domain-containing protein [Siculibacillus lacustris]
MSTPTVTLQEIDQAEAGPWHRLRFSPALEARWEADRGARRSARMATAAVGFAIGFAALGALDSHLVGDVVATASLLRFGVVVPCALALAVLAGRRCPAPLREAGAAGLPVLAAAAMLLVFHLARDPGAAHYPALVALPVLYGNIVLRPRFAFAAAGSTAILAISVAALAAGGLPGGVIVAVSIGLTATAVSTLGAGLVMEREARRAHLRDLRGEIATGNLSHRYDQLRLISQMDPLTGVANRRAVDGHIAEMADRSRQTGEPLALLMIDVDHFKMFNDRYGHPAGDRCLTWVAAATRSQVRRQGDLVGRFGGEEFIVVLPATGLADAIRVGERIRAAIESAAIPHDGNGEGAVVTVSIGVAAGHVSDTRLPRDLLLEADAALYAAKDGGRNRVRPLADPLSAVDDEIPEAIAPERAA